MVYQTDCIIISMNNGTRQNNGVSSPSSTHTQREKRNKKTAHENPRYREPPSERKNEEILTHAFVFGEKITTMAISRSIQTLGPVVLCLGQA